MSAARGVKRPVWARALICAALLGSWTSAGYGGEFFVDCNENGIEDFCDLNNGSCLSDTGCQAIGSQACQIPDCNVNFIPDDCDIAQGTSFDCDGNGVPDECEPDCNENSLTDACDISSGCAPACCNIGRGFSFCGNSEDCNANSIPDECEVPAGVILSVWVGGTGVWSVASNWCPPVVPNNGSGNFYEVLMAGGSAVAALDMSPTINGLTITDGAALRTSADKTIQVLGDVLLDNGGTYGPSAVRGVLPNTTALVVGGNVSILSTLAPGFMDLGDEMTATVLGNLRLDGTGATCLARGGSSPPRLRVRSSPIATRGGIGTSPSLTVIGDIIQNVIADVEVSNDAIVQLLRDWVNTAPPSACFNWTPGTLLMDADNLRTNAHFFELGGVDLGQTTQGFLNNFAMDVLRIGPFATVVFVDDEDNAPGQDCEAHYVRTLILSANSNVILLDCNVYYETLIDEGGTIVLSGTGALLPIEITVAVDIKPGDCPNSFNRSSHGVLSAAILGSADFDVSSIDVSTVRLVRADGVGGEVAPNEGPPGPHTVIDDLGTPFEGATCECHDLAGDGQDDLSIKFKTDDLVPGLLLEALAPGALVELLVTGELNDGTPFVGSDCVRLVPPGTPPGQVAVNSILLGAWVEIAPLDLQLDGGGFVQFDRTYPQGTVLTLGVEDSYLGQRFVGWRFDGEFLSSDMVVDLIVQSDIHAVDLIFRRMGDINGDAEVDLADFSVFASCYGQNRGENIGSQCPNETLALSDLDHSGRVDLRDFAIFALHFGT